MVHEDVKLAVSPGGPGSTKLLAISRRSLAITMMVNQKGQLNTKLRRGVLMGALQGIWAHRIDQILMAGIHASELKICTI